MKQFIIAIFCISASGASPDVGGTCLEELDKIDNDNNYNIEVREKKNQFCVKCC